MNIVQRTSPISTGAIAKTYYTLTDHLRSVHALVDESGTVVEQYRMDVWGRTTACDGSGVPLTQSAIGNRYVWEGREISWVTGLYHFRLRTWDSISGRFLSNDPIGISGGLNQYILAGNCVTMFRDPFGLQGEWFPAGPDIPPGTIYSYQFDPALMNAAIANVLGKVWNAPNTILGLTLGLTSLPFGSSASFGHNSIMFENYPWMAEGGLGLTLGNVTLYKDEACTKYEGELFSIGEHEEQHTYQGELLGVFYLPTYIYGGFRATHSGDSFFGPANFMETGPYSLPPRIWE
jgi:RHS repeat-associated protein